MDYAPPLIALTGRRATLTLIWNKKEGTNETGVFFDMSEVTRLFTTQWQVVWGSHPPRQVLETRHRLADNLYLN